MPPEGRAMRDVWSEITSCALTRITWGARKFGCGLIGFLKACMGFMVEQVSGHYYGGRYPFDPLGFKLTVVAGLVLYIFYLMYSMIYPDCETLKFFIRLFFAADSIRLFAVMFDGLDDPFNREMAMVIFRLALLSFLGVPVLETVFGAFLYQKVLWGNQPAGQPNPNQVSSESEPEDAEQPESSEEPDASEPPSAGDSRQI